MGPQGLPDPIADSKPLSEHCQARTSSPGTSACPKTQFSCCRCNLETNKSNKPLCPLPSSSLCSTPTHSSTHPDTQPYPSGLCSHTP